jgi:hypothetical protein
MSHGEFLLQIHLARLLHSVDHYLMDEESPSNVELLDQTRREAAELLVKLRAPFELPKDGGES